MVMFSHAQWWSIRAITHPVRVQNLDLAGEKQEQEQKVLKTSSTAH
jgi:hypothetical protein